jgi:glutamate synthase (NADPH/NADH) small chain
MPLKERQIERKQPSEERIRNFDEVSFTYTPEEAVTEAERCLTCKKPLCIHGCPVEVDIPEFIEMIRRWDFDAAADSIKRRNNLPAICGRVCPQEMQCEQYCTAGKTGEAVAIGKLERFAADYGSEKPETAPKKDKKVAIVGSGPAGLTAAGDLARMGYTVTLFEALHTPGGVLAYGIPEFRLPKKVVQYEVDYIRQLGVDIQLNTLIGKMISIDELLRMEYGAVFIATGAGLPQFLDMQGENLNGVYYANEYLTRVNLMKAYMFPDYETPIKRGKNVAVVGGGNVAMDAARSARRLGAENVSIIYRRGEGEMSARREEIEHAKEEGVKFVFLSNPTKFLGQNGWLEAVQCVRMELCEPDESGRCTPMPLEGSEFTIECDVAIVAIGNNPNPLIAKNSPDIAATDRGHILADIRSGSTNKKGVFAGGDIVTGAASVISAMGAGKRAAKAIDQYLS